MLRIIAILAFLSTFAVTAQAEERLVVTMHETIYLESRIIRLSDVAHIASPKADLVKKASAVTLGRVKGGKLARTIKRDRVSERLRWAGIGADDFIVVGQEVSVFNAKVVAAGKNVLAKIGAPKAKVEKAPAKAIAESKSDESKEVAKEDDAGPITSFKGEGKSEVLPKALAAEIVSADDIVEEAIRRITKTAASDSSIAIEKIVVKETRRNAKLDFLKAGKLEIKGMQRVQRSQKTFGTHSFNLEIAKNGQSEKDYVLTVQIRHKLLVAVAKRTISARELITEDDVVFEEMLSEVLHNGDFIQDFAEIKHLASKINVPAGHKIMRNRLVKAIVVKRGDRVSYVPAGTSENLRKMFSASGIAQRDGAVGDEITIKVNMGNDPKTGKARSKNVVVKVTGVGTGETAVKAGK